MLIYSDKYHSGENLLYLQIELITKPYVLTA